MADENLVMMMMQYAVLQLVLFTAVALEGIEMQETSNGALVKSIPDPRRRNVDDTRTLFSGT